MGAALFINPTAMEAGLIAAGRSLRLSKPRAAAFEAFAKTGLPNKRMEPWKWTDIRAFLREDLKPVEPVNDVIAPSIFGGVRPYEITIMNGVAEWEGAAPADVSVATRPAAGLDPLAADHPLGNLAGAMSAERIEIRIASNARVDQPILIRRIAGPGVHHARLAIALGKNATTTIIESFDGVGAYFSNSLAEIAVAEGAKLTRLVLQDGSDTGVETSLAAATLGAGAEFHQTALLLGAKAVRLETRLSLEGDGAKSSLRGATALSGGRHADLTSLVTHAALGCVTRQTQKSAVRDRARAVFQGKFLVARGAQKTDAQMTANALLLSEAAEANHKPELEIYADDVQCAHGSTAGALDEDALFYLRQRGLDEKAARALLVEAFLNDAFEEIAHPGIHNVFHQRMMHWLGSAA